MWSILVESDCAYVEECSDKLVFRYAPSDEMVKILITNIAYLIKYGEIDIHETEEKSRKTV